MWWMVDANGLFAGSTVLFLAFVRTQPATHPACPGKPDAARGIDDHMLWVLVSLWVLLYVLITPPRITRGIHWGCRYLLPVYPLLAVLAAGTITRWWQRAGRAPLSRVVVAVALGLTLTAQVYALYLLRCRKAFVRTLNAAIAQRPEQIVIADVWHMPMDLAPNFFQKRIFFPRSERDAVDLARDLRAAGHQRALLIKLLDRRFALPADGLFLCDPPLNFSPVAIGSIALDE